MEISELYEIFRKCTSVTTDSRNCPAGSMFFALKGTSFNGNSFAEKALSLGSAYAVVDEEEYAKSDDKRIILVNDSLETMQQLARYHRRKIGTKIIGITGTNGKTTTKELIAAVLSEKYNVLYTQGNLNNHIGVPRTLLQLTEKHDIAVIEMGANHPGEIRTLVNIVEPDYGIITNVGKAHLEGFGSFEGVIKTKGELYDYLREKHGKVFIDNGNKHLLNISENLELIKYGTDGNANLYVSGEAISCAPLLKFKWKKTGGQWNETQTHLIGSYNTSNMLAAACMGLYFGVTEQQVKHALENYIPENNRSQLSITPYNKLIVDTYNANPTSMMAALENFRDMDVSPKMAILGDMRELGEISQYEHQKITDFLKTSGIEKVWLVGEEFGHTECEFRKFQNVEDVKEEISKHRPEGFHMLIKGSNGTRLFLLPELL